MLNNVLMTIIGFFTLLALYLVIKEFTRSKN